MVAARQDESRRLKKVDGTIVRGLQAIDVIHQTLRKQWQRSSPPQSPTQDNQSNQSNQLNQSSLATFDFSASEPVVRDITKFRASIRDKSHDGQEQAKLRAYNFISVVWSSKPPVVLVDPTKGFGVSVFDDASSMKEASKKYADYIHKLQKAEVDAVEKLKRDIADQQEIEAAKSKERKLAALNEAREQRKQLLRDSLTLKNKFKEEKVAKAHYDKLHKKQVKLQEEEDNERERARIRDIHEEMDERREAKERARKERYELEKIRLRELADSKEYLEIIRRYHEEADMKRCEERRRVIEEKRDKAEADAKKAMQDRQTAARDRADHMTGRVRMGRFTWHDGKKRFYDNVRKTVPLWYKYEDEEGVAFYHDPVTNKTQYRMPVDGPIRDNLDDIREVRTIVFMCICLL